MRKENLEAMSNKELEEYAHALGIPAKAVRQAKNKAEYIWHRWNQTVTVKTLGLELEIPAKLLRDKATIEALSNPLLNDTQADEIIQKLLGEKQYNELVKACTDEDGITDVVALGVAFARILSSEKLKNL